MAVALITGASRGLGRALGRELAARGWDLVVDARDGAALAEAAGELAGRTGGGRVEVVTGDVTDRAHRAALAAAWVRFGGLDALVENAGILGPSPLPAVGDLEPGDLRQVLETNVIAPAALVTLALPSLRRRKGAVVAVTSDAAILPYPGWAAYGAAKAALEQLHHVLGAEEPGIRVYRFDPGDMRTRMHQEAFPGEDISDRAGPEVAASALARLLDDAPPTGRYRTADLAPVRGGSR